MAEIKEDKVKVQKSKFKVWFIRLLLFILFLPILLSILFQFPFFQNYIADKTTDYLSEKMGTKVSISKIDVSIFDGLILEKFTMYDSEKDDTLIYAKNLNVVLSKNLFSLYYNNLSINSVKLVEPHVSIIIDRETGQSNLNKYLQKIFPSKADGGQSSFNLNIKDLSVVRAKFELFDERNGSHLKSSLQEGKIKVKSLDFSKGTFIIESVNLLDPAVDILAGSKMEKQSKAKGSSKPFCLTIFETQIKNGGLYKHETKSPLYVNHFDAKNFNISGIDVAVKNLNYGGINDIFANIENLSATFGQKDFQLKQLTIPALLINDENINLFNFKIETAESILKDNISISYDSFEDLKRSVNNGYLQADLTDSEISLQEFAYFLPKLKELDFYKKYSKNKLSVNGVISGNLENIKGNKLQLNFADLLKFDGNFGIRNVTKKEELFLALKVQSLHSNVDFIKDIIPGFNPPDNFYTLGKFNFSGYFDGYLNDFVTDGKLVTEIGTADVDVKLNVKNGNENASYRGEINLIDFDLYKWSKGNKNLGKISFNAKVEDGKSLILKNASADIDAVVKSFDFKGYQYHNIKLDGKVTPNKFEGTLLSDDPNVNLNFDGIVEFNDQNNRYDFTSTILNIDLKRLNLSKDYSDVKGKFTFKGEGKNINDLIGKLDARNIEISRRDTLFQFDSIKINSFFINGTGNKKLEIITEKAKVDFEGKYDFGTLVSDLKSMVKNNFPYHTRNWNIQTKNISENQIFKYDISILEGQQIFEILGIKELELNNFKAKGYINSKTSEISLASSLPSFVLKKNKFFGIQLLFNNRLRNGDIFLQVDSSFVEGRSLNQIDMQYLIKGDSISFDIKAPELIDSVQNIDLKGLITPHPQGYTVSILNNDIRLFGKRWKLNNETKISIGKKYINIENAVITDGNRMIQVEDIQNKGIYLALNQIDINSLNPIIKYDKIQFGGLLNSSISVSNIFESSPEIDGSISVPRLLLNNDSYGELTVDITKAEGKPLDALVSISNLENGQAIKIIGKYDFDKKYVSADFKARKTPMKFLYYILKKGVSKVDGYIDFDADISGTLPDVKINGRGKAFDGAVRVIYLGETYYFNNQNFGITENRIDLSGAVIKDSQGNEGVISGGLNHTLFKDFHLDASIYAEDVIAVNTTKYDNPIYYGLGKGVIEADFSGHVDAPRMVINAVTTRGTNISIPIKETRTNSDRSFITFVDKEEYLLSKNDSLAKQQEVKIEGMTIELNLTLTEAATVNLIFDELKNDVIKGVGNGNLRITMTPSGEFTMFGNYSISRGEYLFTAFDFVNKPFIVREGGTIRWTGDPVNASLNIEADYQVRTTLSPFLAEYLVTDDLKRAAAVSSQVNLKLLLGNTLYNPSVKFDLEFPELTGEMKSYTDSKLRLLRNNDAEFYNQVLGLIVFNSFLPSSTLNEVVGSNNFIQSAGINTLSEFVSNQLSLFVTGLVNEALEDNGLISGVDFDIALRNNTSFQGLAGSASLLPSEIEVRLKNKFRFLDERLSVNIAGNYVRENTLPTGLDNYVIPEFFVEYALTKDRQLNLKLYGKYDLDEISVTNRRQKFGLGLRYKNEFGSIVETKSKLTDGLKKLLLEKNNKG